MNPTHRITCYASPKTESNAAYSRWRAGVNAVVFVALLVGCQANNTPRFSNAKHYPTGMDRIHAVPNVSRVAQDNVYSLPPRTSADDLPSSRDISLDEVLQISLSNTEILRSLGAQVLVTPQNVAAVYDPAITRTDPVFGVEAALSQFDALMNGSLNHANNDNVFNNATLGGGATEVLQDLTTADFGLQKTAATGTQYSFRTNVTYDNNNLPGNLFTSSYQALWEAQVRQPLIQGRGIDFNRIAGPQSQPGFRTGNGVILARIDHDVSLAQFELGVRQFIDEVIAAYWELQFAYRNFEANRIGRDTALEIWNSVKSRFDNDMQGGEADSEAQAREQYFLFQQQLVTALNGDPLSGLPGVLQAESNLRRLIGLPQSDGVLLYPSDEASRAMTVFDWNSLVQQALNRRVEIRSQLWQIKRRELELLASRNFLLPRLDYVATYRNNGFGDDLIGGGSRFSSAVSDMSTGDHNEWEMGLQFNVPLGYRQANAGVRNSELRLQRERAILDEQEKQILHDLGSAVRQTEQQGSAVDLSYNRLVAANDTLQARQAGYDADSVPLDLLLDAQRRLSEAQTAFFRALVNLQLANVGVERESGRLLHSHAIMLDELIETSSASCQQSTSCRQCRQQTDQDINFGLR
ncbi:MAG: TolC family protein [Planctomycetota bacterium]